MRLHLRHKQQHVAVDLETVGRTYHVVIDGVTHVVEAEETGDGLLALVVDGRRYRVAVARQQRERLVAVNGEAYSFHPEAGSPTSHSLATAAPPEITAPMPGKVLQVLVQPGDHVASGDGLLILEAMKMENRLVADAAGTVTEVRVASGDMVDGGQVLVVLSYDRGCAPA